MGINFFITKGYVYFQGEKRTKKLKGALTTCMNFLQNNQANLIQIL